MKEYIRRYFMLRRHNMKVAIKKAKMSKMCYAFLAYQALARIRQNEMYKNAWVLKK